jgi:hypothetical protein
MVYFTRSLFDTIRYKLLFVKALRMRCEPTCVSIENHFEQCEYYEQACLSDWFPVMIRLQILRVHSYHSKHHKDKSSHWNFCRHINYPSKMPRSYLNNQSTRMGQASSYQQKLKIHLVILRKYLLHLGQDHCLLIKLIHFRKLHSL